VSFILCAANPDDPKVAPRILGRGLAASAGAAIGKVVFTIEDAKEFRDRDVNCILVRPETSADDIEGLKVSDEWSSHACCEG
jgi:phosphoenolpyruvate synthase/pyruvate phosphate dikinase